MHSMLGDSPNCCGPAGRQHFCSFTKILNVRQLQFLSMLHIVNIFYYKFIRNVVGST